MIDLKRWKDTIRHSLLPSRIGPRRVLAGPLRGATLVTSWHDYPGALTGRTERELLAWFTGHCAAGSTWLDVGAHYGYTALALARLVGHTGRVFAFEPMMQTAGHLAETVRLNNASRLTVIPLALCDSRDMEQFDATVERGMIDMTRAHGPTRPSANPRSGFLGASLDWLWPKIAGSDQHIDGIKIDVQGMEMQALNGMRRLLKEQQPQLVVEFHTGVDRRQILELLASCGYSSPGTPIDDVSESPSSYRDDVSYAFQPRGVSAGRRENAG